MQSADDKMDEAVEYRYENKFKAKIESFYTQLLRVKNKATALSKNHLDFRHPHSLLSDKYESLDYDPCENSLDIEYENDMTYKDIKCLHFQRWVVMLLIGIITALIACFIDISIEYTTEAFYSFMKDDLDVLVHNLHFNDHQSPNLFNLYFIKPYLTWLAFGLFFVLVSALLVAYVEPMAGGSGISQIKCFLNGVKIPNIVRLKTLLVKIIGIILAIAGGLVIGKEGPMVHIGAIVGAGISQGCSTTLKWDWGIFKNFRRDTEKRDFVSAGTAAGISAAFGAPVGGVLLALEEGASFWNQGLTWRIFFASMTSTFTLNVIMSAYKGHPGELSNTGLLNFGKLDDIYYSIKEVPIYVLMAVLGGLLGAIFNAINIRITLYRMKHITTPMLKISECVLVSLVTCSSVFMLIYYSNSCAPLPTNGMELKRPVKMFCADGEYNSIATMLFQTAEERIRGFFHDETETYNAYWLLMVCIVWYVLAIWTFGVSVPSGIFIPCILLGAGWGRLIGVGVAHLFPKSPWAQNTAKFALIGAAVQLGGVVRMTLSLTVMLIEATGNITFGIVLMFCLMITKWVGDLFTEGIYDAHIHILSIPFLGWEPPPQSTHITANEIMSHPVTTLRTIERCSTIINILASQKHNGFPLVDTTPEPHRCSFGRFRGLILRQQLLVILLHQLRKEFYSNRSKFYLTLDPMDPNATYTSIDDESPKLPELTSNNLASSTGKKDAQNLSNHLNIPVSPLIYNESDALNKQQIDGKVNETNNKPAAKKVGENTHIKGNFFSFSLSSSFKLQPHMRNSLISPNRLTTHSEEDPQTNENNLLLPHTKNYNSINQPIHHKKETDLRKALLKRRFLTSESSSDKAHEQNLVEPTLEKPNININTNTINTTDKNILISPVNLSKTNLRKQKSLSFIKEGKTRKTSKNISIHSLPKVLHDSSLRITARDFRSPYPRFFDIQDLDLSFIDPDAFIDLSPYCCKAPYTVSYSATLPRVFRLFRALGLRHLTVINEKNEVVGMITRKDVARYRWFESRNMGYGAVKELKIFKG